MVSAKPATNYTYNPDVHPGVEFSKEGSGNYWFVTDEMRGVILLWSPYGLSDLSYVASAK